MTALVVNFYSGPSAGKSTLTAATFAALKWNYINCEMALEYAKDKVWEESISLLNNQLYVFGKQQHRLYRLADKVDVIVTDAPLLNSIYYDAKENLAFRELIHQEYKKYRNLNFFVQRVRPYHKVGRLQTEEEAIEIDGEIINVLEKYADNNFILVRGEPESVDQVIVPKIIETLKQNV